MIFKSLFRKKPLPDFIEQYNKHFTNQLSGSTEIEDLRFVVFDTETTGLDTTNSKLLSFGGIGIHHLKLDIKDSLELVFNYPDITVHDTADIHGILKSHTKEKGVEPISALKQILSYLGNAVLVAHHSDFDCKMINQAISEKFPNFRLKNKVIDTSKLALRLEHFNDGYIHKPKEYTLDALCERYNISTKDRHTAAGDAFITAKLFLKLLNKCKSRGITTYRDLVR